ncbi:MAG: hypothetical protein EBT68_00005, partial [Verrucomicrobia bacterium]|nr:hypothetical protein [Verrucomicrobiota bacterium]
TMRALGALGVHISEVALTEKSRQRLDSDPDVAFLREDIQKVKSRLETGTISLNEDKRVTEKGTEDIRNGQRKAIEERIEKTLPPVTHLVIDGKKNTVVATDKNPKKKKPSLEESADESEGVTDAVDLAEILELREGLRIMGDWLALSTPPASTTIAKDKDPHKTTTVK